MLKRLLLVPILLIIFFSSSPKKVNAQYPTPMGSCAGWTNCMLFLILNVLGVDFMSRIPIQNVTKVSVMLVVSQTPLVFQVIPVLQW